MFLILDFTKSLRLAVLDNVKFISSEIKIKKNISEILIFETESFLKKIDASMKKVNSIYIVTGPGSFTGIRTALTFAKSLKLTMNINIRGVSRFEIINYSLPMKTVKKRKCIFLHFKENQFFIQTFIGFKPVNEPRLINFNNKNFKYYSQTSYVYDNILLEENLENKMFKKIKDDLHLIEYNLDELHEIILNNMIDNTDPKPLYISNYY